MFLKFVILDGARSNLMNRENKETHFVEL
jgi:hypothetical protein